MMDLRGYRYAIFAACLMLLGGFAWLMVLNQQSLFTRGEIGAFYSDAQYIAQVAANIVQGYSYSYWDGYIYSFWDYEISSGPIVIYPVALALKLGLDKYHALFFVPLFINCILLTLFVALVFRQYSAVVALAVSVIVGSLFLGIQRWLWYLPLGEVSGVLLLLLSLFFLLETSRWRWAALLLGASILSKLVFVLCLPVIVFFVLWQRGLHAAFKFAVFCLLPILGFICVLFAFSPDSVSLVSFIERFYTLLMDSFFWSIPEYVYSDQIGEFGFLQRLLWNVKVYNGVWWDNWDFTLLVIVLAIFVVLTTTAWFYSRELHKRQTIVLLYGVAIVFFVWAFCIGLKGGRYGYPLYITLFFSCLYCLKLVPKSLAYCAFVLLLGLSVHHINKRGWVLEQLEIDAVAENAMAADSLVRFMAQSGNATVLFGPSLKVPYLDLAYHLPRSDMLVSVYAYLDKLPMVLHENECRSTSWPHKFKVLSAGEKQATVAPCIEAGQPVVLSAIDETILLLEFNVESSSCGSVVWQSNRYQLFSCSKDQFSGYIRDLTKGLVAIQ